MDVERLQKINDLALELMKQGLVEDREEAVQRAEDLLRRKDDTSLKDAMATQRTAVVEEPKTSLTSDKIEEILQKNNTFIVKTIKEFQEQISKMQAEINGLRSEVKIQRTAPAPQQKLETPKKEQVDHPRSGNYKDNDVSIEKFFYSGTK